MKRYTGIDTIIDYIPPQAPRGRDEKTWNIKSGHTSRQQSDQLPLPLSHRITLRSDRILTFVSPVALSFIFTSTFFRLPFKEVSSEMNLVLRIFLGLCASKCSDITDASSPYLKAAVSSFDNFNGFTVVVDVLSPQKNLTDVKCELFTSSVIIISISLSSFA